MNNLKEFIKLNQKSNILYFSSKRKRTNKLKKKGKKIEKYLLNVSFFKSASKWEKNKKQ